MKMSTNSVLTNPTTSGSVENDTSTSYPYAFTKLNPTTDSSSSSAPSPSMTIPTLSSSPSTPLSYILYNRRFFVLFVFALLSFNQSTFWLTFSPVAYKTEQYYGHGLGEHGVDLLLNWGAIIYLPCVPFASYFASSAAGLRKAVLFTAITCSLSTALRCIPTWIDSSSPPWYSIYIIHVAQILNAACGPVVMTSVSKFSCVWFGAHERAISTAVAVLSNNFGSAIAFLITPYIVQESSDMPKLLYFHAIWALFAMILTLIYFPAQPPTPPSHAAEEMDQLSQEDENNGVLAFFKNVWLIMHDPSYVWLAISGGVINGVFNAWTGVLNTILRPLGYTDEQTGWFGFASTIASIVGGIAFGTIAERTSLGRRMKGVIFVLSALSAMAFVWFSLSLPSVIDEDIILPSNLVAVSFAITCCGLFVGSSNPLYYELAAELTFPISESISAGIITIYNNVACLVVLFVAPTVSGSMMNAVMTCIALFCTLCIIPVKEQYKRRAEDEARIKALGSPLLEDTLEIDSAHTS